ncbi:hypothetical protein [Methylobacterium sp. Leaf100]|uniref:DUF7483 domain-containing protein n=1 Tax=Methylobacterium sp. Leaf100 TaxID=1736252 RepID=UPI000AA3476E|nr:hypothetical protein [Methylobacterium sp. Leaf100]
MFPFAAPAIIKPAIAGGAILKPQDVFATDLWTGDGAEKTIVNGIDFLGRGGAVLEKARDIAQGWLLTDTPRGPTRILITNNTDAEYTGGASVGVVQFNNNGYRFDAIAAPYKRVGYSLARAAKFFDIVTWTGDGTSNRLIPHALGVVPGMIIGKGRNSATGWPVYHRSLPNPAADYLTLQTTSAYATASTLYGALATATSFTVNPSFNQAGVDYVGLVFAHDPSADGIVQCGSFSLDGTFGATVNLGWQPQFVLIKAASGTNSAWLIMDGQRGFGSGCRVLQPNDSAAEFGPGNYMTVSSSGFTLPSGQLYGAARDIIYLAIRAPY